MELGNVKQIITPNGNLKKILRSDGVVVWSKPSNMQYTIWKNGVLIDQLTINQFVNKIHDGSAQTDYGIGAQIMIPYHDPLNDVYYDCPFNFGTFAEYPGKLGLQTHYALPSSNVAYGPVVVQTANTAPYSCAWKSSYLYQWLNSKLLSGTMIQPTNIGSGTIDKTFDNKRGFLKCIPEDFVDAVQTISFANTECKFFLLRVTEVSAAPSINVNTSTGYTQRNCTENFNAWEYWTERIGYVQPYYQKKSSQTGVVGAGGNGYTIPADTNRIVYSLANKSSAVQITTPTGVTYRTKSNGVISLLQSYNAGFDTYGKQKNMKASSKVFFQPACVIG